MRFTHLYIPSRFNYKIYLIPGFENCFSGLEFLKCDLDNNDQSILEELTRTSKSIKNLELTFFGAYIPGLSGITKLIETQKELSNVSYLTYYRVNESSRKSLEDSLIKRTNNTLQYLKINKEPSNIKFFSYFVDLISLEINDSYNDSWKHLVDATLPHLKFLKAKNIPSNNLAKLIENTSEELEEISINSLRCNDSNYGDLIQTIAQSCPNLKYFMLILRNRDIINLEKVLINCQYLSGLNIVIYKYDFDFDWKKLFIILTKSSPIGLYKFKFYIFHDKSLSRLNSDSFNLFFANWKGRQPMLLQTVPIYSCISFKKYFNLIETYKAKGIVKKYEYVKHENIYYEEFEWINQRI
ncbi:hypothetical protein GLOIN_2v1878750 [Rhizophagus clarus]|nr:hypothetical protein GLOIN_2v1878750 [Rhizophagus clarus]